MLDVWCVLVLECYIYKSYDDDDYFVFILIIISNKDCICCKNICLGFYVECLECEFVLCYVCVIILYELYYKYDKYLFIFCYGEEEMRDFKYWCEIFENKLYVIKWFYICDFCRVIFYVKCLLGKEVYYMKLNYIIKINGKNVDIELCLKKKKKMLILNIIMVI